MRNYSYTQVYYQPLVELNKALERLQDLRLTHTGDNGRYYSVAITDLEKLMAYVDRYLNDDVEYSDE